jgi:hypothetical protein
MKQGCPDGRVTYNYNQRYFLTATARRDGYSAFGQENPRANFPSLDWHGHLVTKSFMERVKMAGLCQA